MHTIDLNHCRITFGVCGCCSCFNLHKLGQTRFPSSCLTQCATIVLCWSNYVQEFVTTGNVTALRGSEVTSALMYLFTCEEKSNVRAICFVILCFFHHVKRTADTSQPFQMRISVFCDVALCGLVEIYRRFRCVCGTTHDRRTAPTPKLFVSVRTLEEQTPQY
jgi:hypothetical protein